MLTAWLSGTGVKYWPKSLIFLQREFDSRTTGRRAGDALPTRGFVRAFKHLHIFPDQFTNLIVADENASLLVLIHNSLVIKSLFSLNFLRILGLNNRLGTQ